MKKFILFQWDNYEAFGGLRDMRGDYDSLEEAKQVAKKNGRDVSEIIDRDTWCPVWECDNGDELPEPPDKA